MSSALPVASEVQTPPKSPRPLVCPGAPIKRNEDDDDDDKTDQRTPTAPRASYLKVTFSGALLALKADALAAGAALDAHEEQKSVKNSVTL